MNKKEGVFVHSSKLHTTYKEAVAIAKKVIINRESIHVIFNNLPERQRRNLTNIKNILNKTFDNKDLLDKTIEKSLILKENDRLDYYVCLILVTELLLGKQTLLGNSKQVETVLKYHETLKTCFTEEEQYNPIRNKVSFPRYVRVNTIKISINDAKEYCLSKHYILNDTEFTSYKEYLNAVSELKPHGFLIDFHIKELFVFHSSQAKNFALDEYVTENKLILQDKASCIPALMLNLKKNKCVLDMCASPGMKTTQIAAMLKNKGTVYSIEKDTLRYEELVHMVKTKGAKCVKTILNDATNIIDEDVPNVDCILVDPSCSGSGIYKRGGVSNNDDRRLLSLSGFQKTILSHAMRSFPNANRIVYSTCSINPEENEEVVKSVLYVHPEFKIIDVLPMLKNSWLNFGSDEYKFGNKCIYTYAETDYCNGFFVAVFERRDLYDDDGDDAEQNVEGKKVKKRKVKANPDEGNHEGAVDDDVEKKFERKKKKKRNVEANPDEDNHEGAGDDDVEKKFEREKKKKRNVEANPDEDNHEGAGDDNVEKKIERKKKKKRKVEANPDEDNNHEEAVEEN